MKSLLQVSALLLTLIASPAFAAELNCKHDGLQLTGTLNDIGQIENLVVAEAGGQVRFQSAAPLGASSVQHGNYTFVMQDEANVQQSLVIPPTFGQNATSQIYYNVKANGAAQAPIAFECPTNF